MAEPASALHGLKNGSFASLLTGFARGPEPPWNDAALAEDVATISYEQALRTHARARPADQAALPAGPPAPSQETGMPPRKPPVSVRISEWTPEAEDAAETRAPEAAASPLEGSRKRSSVTIRLTRTERDQLHARAEEAGMTISAYLRSCVFEAEALRAQVKEALSEMRAGQGGGGQAVQEAAGAPGWRERLHVLWKGNRRVGTA